MKNVCIPYVLLYICIILSTFTTISYAQTERWVYTYNGSTSTNDSANAIVCGTDGNIYAAGMSNETGGSGYNFTVLSLTPSGSERWVYNYHGAGNVATANSIVYGADGNIYAAGCSEPSGGSTDITIVSLTNTGNERWVYCYYSGFDDEAYCITYGSDGNLYVAGVSDAYDFTVISLTTSGTERWVYNYDGPANYLDEAYSVVYGSDGNIYVAGMSCGVGTDNDFTVISLTSSGSERWVYRNNGTGDYKDDAFSIVCGTDGNIYAAGHIWGASTYDDFTVVSLTPSGSERWVYTYNNQNNYGDIAYSITYGSDGYIYAGGTTCVLSIISLTSSGAERWVYRSDYQAFRANAVVHGSDGYVYAAGYSGDHDFVVVSVSSLGNERWLYSYNGPWNMRDYAYDLVYGADGYIYAAGYSGVSINNYYDFTVISLDTTTGIEEGYQQTVANSNYLTIFSGPLLLPKDKNYRVLDITGRTVVPDKMKPGVYFIEVEGKITQKVVKVR